MEMHTYKNKEKAGGKIEADKGEDGAIRLAVKTVLSLVSAGS